MVRQPNACPRVSYRGVSSALLVHGLILCTSMANVITFATGFYNAGFLPAGVSGSDMEATVAQAVQAAFEDLARQQQAEAAQRKYYSGQRF